ncbi:MAG: hypothetical protein J6W03_07445 [Bacteroidaceae bacterium]|nr:hypothetical protein [Bacteroidaceae bacterium]
MKKILLTAVIVIMANAANAQKLIVYSLMGKVEDVTNSTARAVQLRDALEQNTVLNIPYHGCIVLYDELKSQQLTFKTPGRATVKEMMSDKRNSVKKLTGHYVSYIKKQITRGGQVMLRNCSDPATVTRNLMITTSDENASLMLCGTDGFSEDSMVSESQKEDPFKKDFQTWRNEMLKDYQDFRKKMLHDYADFVRNPWNKMKLSPAEEKPKDESIEPIKIDGDGGKPIVPDFENIDNENKHVPVISILPLPQPMPTPEPVAPIKENHDFTNQYHSFMFFGTEMKVRWTEDCAFHLKSLKEKDVANAIDQLSDIKYDNLLYDCIQLRSNYHLSDWAYYLMLKELCISLCGNDTNEATLLQTVLFSQSGYRTRFAKKGNKLLMMVSTQYYLYGYCYMIIDGYHYYLFDDDYDEIDVCMAQFPKEQEMSLIIKESPSFSNDNSEVRTIASFLYPQLKAQVSVNKNLINFYSSYPTSYFNNDFMTRWAMYANKEMQPEVRKQLYPQLQAIIEGKSQRDGAECILKWIQTGFTYGYDSEVWGNDRAFFPEESLFYPSCDCEDRSILFTRLVRDLLGLKCILVFYPGHLASGVCFTENVEGDYIDVKNERYVICDPTIIGAGAPVGVTMSEMDNSSASVIVLE